MAIFGVLTSSTGLAVGRLGRGSTRGGHPSIRAAEALWCACSISSGVLAIRTVLAATGVTAVIAGPHEPSIKVASAATASTSLELCHRAQHHAALGTVRLGILVVDAGLAARTASNVASSCLTASDTHLLAELVLWCCGGLVVLQAGVGLVARRVSLPALVADHGPVSTTSELTSRASLALMLSRLINIESSVAGIACFGACLLGDLASRAVGAVPCSVRRILSPDTVLAARCSVVGVGVLSGLAPQAVVQSSLVGVLPGAAVFAVLKANLVGELTSSALLTLGLSSLVHVLALFAAIAGGLLLGVLRLTHLAVHAGILTVLGLHLALSTGVALLESGGVTEGTSVAVLALAHAKSLGEGTRSTVVAVLLASGG